MSRKARLQRWLAGLAVVACLGAGTLALHHIHADVLGLKRVRRQLLEDMKATITRYERMLSRDGVVEEIGRAHV